MEQDRPDSLTGSRIRERRLARAMKQGALAQAVGISPSYLNLIEHNHRRIGGKLLVALAHALEVDPSDLTEGADPGLSELLDMAARGQGDRNDGGAGAEIDRIDEFTARFPGWSALIAAQEGRMRALEAQVEALRDRLAHDPALAEAMHEVLSSVAAIRSTADILVCETDLDAAWRGRFHRNLHEEAERLSGRATGLLAQFEAPGLGPDASAPTETVEALFEASGHHFPEIEALGAAGIDAVLARSAGMRGEAAHALARARLSAYARDAARLPMAVFGPAALVAGFDPAALLGLAGGDVALVLRRMASVPVDLGAPERGLAVCDAAGAVIQRRRLPGFPLPRVASGCPLWPLYRVLARPGQAETAVLEMPRGGRFRAWAVAQTTGAAGFGDLPVVQATMLVMPLSGGLSGGVAGGLSGGLSGGLTGGLAGVAAGVAARAGMGAEVIAVGPGCEACPRERCGARR